MRWGALTSGSEGFAALPAVGSCSGAKHAGRLADRLAGRRQVGVQAAVDPRGVKRERRL
jgi:hypothetical protein